MKNFADLLIAEIKNKNNPSIGGLDPKLEYIPEHILNESLEACDGDCFKAAGRALFKFNKGLVDATCDVIPAVKIQMAYYEMYGLEGMKAFYRTAEYAKSKGLVVVADGKRNDIGSTSQAYSTAYLGKTDFSVFGNKKQAACGSIDCLTVNPYLGIDGIEPFLQDCKELGRGIYILVKTSNPSSKQIQDKEFINEEKVYENVADLVNEWGIDLVGEYGYSSVGAVVGATWPEQAKELRERMPHTFFLVPGYGAQGGSGKSVSVNFDKNGLGAIVNSSRSFMCAYKNSEWKDKFTSLEYAEAARAEMIRMRDEINSFIY